MARRTKGGFTSNAPESQDPSLWIFVMGIFVRIFLVLGTLALFFYGVVTILRATGVIHINTEHFSPTTPSETGDKKEVTPAGNVILY